MSSTLKLQYDFINSPGLAAHNGIGPTLDITRATTATFLDQDSIVRTVAAGEARFTGVRRVENLLLESNDFTLGSTWVNQNSGTGLAATTTGSFAAAPDGTVTASRLQMDLSGGTTSGDISRIAQTMADPGTQERTFSIYMKSNDSNTYVVQIINPVGGGTGVTVTPTWQQFDVTGTQSTSIDAGVRLRGGQTPINSDTADILIWHGQYENVSGQLDPSPSEYIATTAAAVANVFTTDKDGEDIVATRPGLLVEEARTNICLQSEDLSTTWAQVISGTGLAITVTTNAGVAPDGSTTADRLQCDLNGGTASGDVSQIDQSFVGLANPHDMASSVYLISNTGSDQEIQIDHTGGVSTVTVTPTWERFSLTASSVAFTTDRFRIGLRGNAATEDVCDILVWGGQKEVAAFPTSYVATTTTSETRDADVVSTTDVSWHNQPTGTWFARATLPDVDGAARYVLDSTVGASGAEIYSLFATTPNTTAQMFAESASGADANIQNTSQFAANVEVSFAGCYAVDDYELFTNGFQGIADTTAPVADAPDELFIGCNHNSISQFGGHIAEIRYYDVRKDNDFLEDLSNGIFHEMRHTSQGKRHNRQTLRHQDTSLEHLGDRRHLR